MTEEQRLIRNLREAVGPSPLAVYQGIVTAVDGITCTVQFGAQQVEGVRLRASEAEEEAQLLLVPRVGSPVVVGSLSGDLAELVVLQMDAVERIEINGGKLGGLVNIEPLVEKLNLLAQAFNNHTHTIPPAGVVVGTESNAAPVGVPAPTGKVAQVKRSDLEDDTVKH